SAYEVNCVNRELFKHSRRIKIQRQLFDMLSLLVHRSGEVVSREELQQRLWPDHTFLEYEDSLNTAVRKLRAVLSDSSDLPRYIETVPGRGYRFIAEVLRPQERRGAESVLIQTSANADPQGPEDFQEPESEVRKAHRRRISFGRKISAYAGAAVF